MELEQHFQLLQKYGVTYFKNNEFECHIQLVQPTIINKAEVSENKVSEEDLFFSVENK